MKQNKKQKKTKPR